MDTDYDNMTIVELRALARARGLRDFGYAGLRRAGLIAFLQDNATLEPPVRPSNVHNNVLRMVELTALARECGLLGYSKLRKAGLITLLRENGPILEPSVSTNPRSSSAARPPRLTRPLPPPPEDSFAPYELERVFRGLIRVFELMEETGWTWKPFYERPEEALLISRPENSVIWMR